MNNLTQPKSLNTYLVSVKPQWANLFFDHTQTKSVELRKGDFGKSLVPGDRLLIYATLPVGKILGSVAVRDRKTFPVAELREVTEHLAQVSAEDFADYYQGKDVGVGVWVENPELLEYPISLHLLKEFAGITPPQQITKLSEEQVYLLLSDSFIARFCSV